YPAKVTVGDFMKLLERPDTDPARTALFMPTAEGPCRFGQYAPYLRQILDAHGYGMVEILSPTSRNAYAGLGELAKPFVRTGWRAGDIGRRPAAKDAAAVPALRGAARRHGSGLRGIPLRPLRHARIHAAGAAAPVAVVA